MSTLNPEMPAGGLQLYDYYKPPLEAGNYTIEVAHTLGIAGAETFRAKQEFVVSAPQFTLNPDQVVNQYPPAGSTGKYGEVLPHVVLKDPMLAWERRMHGHAAAATAAEGPVPWLALLVFEEGELLPGDDPTTQTTTAGILAFQALKDTQCGAHGKMLVPTPEIADDIQEALADESAHRSDASYRVAPCRYIKLPAALFQQVVPRLDELRYLSHVRKVNTGDRPALGLSEHGLYAVTMANRFPGVPADVQGTAQKNIVHLVSLEGMADYLKEPALPADYQVVGLLSLASWTFFAQHDLAQDFEALADNLLKGTPESRWLRLPLPPQPPTAAGLAPAHAEVQRRISLGYAPLAYHTRSGENTMAWYRGPLAPQPPAGPRLGPFVSADAALIYDTNFDVFDVSLAAAWELGREVALADVTFGPKMLHFRRNAGQLLDTLHHQLGSVHLAGGQATDVEQETNARLNRQIAQLELTTVQEALARLLTDVANPLAMSAIDAVGTKATDSAAQAADTAATIRSSTAAPLPASGHLELAEMLTRLSSLRAAKAKLYALLAQDIAPLADWLSRFLLLGLVPFDNLVPDERLLPAESLRFFYLDEHWFRAALDGALSLGQDSSKHDFINALVKEALLEEAKLAATKPAAAQKSASSPPASSSSAPVTLALPDGISGFLLRSDIVVGWPNLAVYPTDDKGDALRILRIDHLAPGILLCLFAGVPKQLVLSEPPESLRFGIESHGGVALRDTSGHEPIGHQLPGEPVRVRDMHPDPSQRQALGLRAPLGRRVLHLAPGSPALGIAPDEKGLISTLKKGFPTPLADLSPAAFALQLVKAPEALRLAPNP